ncbi:MAG: hypothetical protein QW803_10800 [Candidatus Methanomethylicia archaeon]
MGIHRLRLYDSIDSIDSLVYEGCHPASPIPLHHLCWMARLLATSPFPSPSTTSLLVGEEEV